MAEQPVPRAADLEIACQEFVELVTEHLEGTLPERAGRAIAAHLELCEPCRIYLEQMRSTATALRTVDVPSLPAPARERLLEVFTALHGDGRGGRP